MSDEDKAWWIDALTKTNESAEWQEILATNGWDNVFLTGDLEMARRLLRQKIEIRDLERRSTERHYERIGAGQSESIDTSSLHLDVLRDLKRINSHLTAVAYPILERAGELTETRLRQSHADRAAERSATRDQNNGRKRDGDPSEPPEK